MSSAATFTDGQGYTWTISIPGIGEEEHHNYAAINPPQPWSYDGAVSHSIIGEIPLSLGDASCISVPVADLFSSNKHGFTPVGTVNEQDIIHHLLQSIVDSVAASGRASYDDATLAIVEQLERLLQSVDMEQADEEYNQRPEYIKTLARQAAESFWDYAYEPAAPVGVRRESAVELVGMGVITLATALGALVLRFRRRSQNGKMPKSVKVAVMRKIQLAPPSSRIRPAEHVRPVNEDEPEAERPKPASSPKAGNAVRHGKQEIGNADSAPSQQRPPRERANRSSKNKAKRQVLVGISDELPPARKITIQSAIAASQAMQLRPVVDSPPTPKHAANESTPKNRPRSRSGQKAGSRRQPPPTAAASRLAGKEGFVAGLVNAPIQDEIADGSDPETSRPLPAEEASLSDEENSDISYWEAIGEGNREDWHFDNQQNLSADALLDDEIDRLLELKRAEGQQAHAERIVPPPQDIGGFTSVLDIGPESLTTRFHTDIAPRSDKQRILKGATKVIGGMVFTRELPVPPCVISYIHHLPSHLHSHFHHQLSHYHLASNHFHNRSPLATERHKNTDRADLHRNNNEANKSKPNSAVVADSREKPSKKTSTVSRSRGECPKRSSKRASRFRLLLPPPGLGHSHISHKS